MRKTNIKDPGPLMEVKMKFTKEMFYNDMTKPEFEPNKIYTLKGAGWIQRWLKRGGIIVEGEFTMPEVTPEQIEAAKAVVSSPSEPAHKDAEPVQAPSAPAASSNQVVVPVEPVKDEEKEVEKDEEPTKPVVDDKKAGNGKPAKK